MEAIRKCSVEECERKHFAKGYCNTHYYRLRRNGRLLLKTRDQYAVHTRDAIIGSCEVDGCARPAKRWSATMRTCGMHAHRYDRTGQFSSTRAWNPAPPTKRPCAVDDCDVTEDGRSGYCKLHGTRLRRHGDPAVFIPQKDRDVPRGREHAMWAGNGVGYGAAHDRIRRRRGRASDFMCSCGARASQWAYQHNDPDEIWADNSPRRPMPYSTKIECYEPMCSSCHRILDNQHVSQDGI